MGRPLLGRFEPHKLVERPLKGRREVPLKPPENPGVPNGGTYTTSTAFWSFRVAVTVRSWFFRGLGVIHPIVRYLPALPCAIFETRSGRSAMVELAPGP